MNQRRRMFANPLFDLIAFCALAAVVGMAVYHWYGAGDASFTLNGIHRAFRELHEHGRLFYPLLGVGAAALWFRPGGGAPRVG